MRFKSQIVIGRGDALLKYPELLDDYDPSLLPQQPYVAVHLDASTPDKVPPNSHTLENLANPLKSLSKLCPVLQMDATFAPNCFKKTMLPTSGENSLAFMPAST